MKSSAVLDDADVRVIVGPTAAGKSAVAMTLAARDPSVIISADSRQVYRGFDIGTAKPTVAERSTTEHRGIDVVDPTERYSAAAWAELASSAIEETSASGLSPLVVGGTGLYLRALFDGLFEEPPLDMERRRGLSLSLDALDTLELRRWVHELDPARSHLGRTQLLRSIEIALLTGRRLTELHRENMRRPRWRPRYLLVDPGPALAERIASRIDHMLDHGWPEEVQRLMITVPEDAPAWNATGYDVVRDLVAGSISRETARERILVATRQYAKRQRTWFRHQLPANQVTTVNPLSSDVDALVTRWAAAVDAQPGRSS
jgi:tRNA dimethylallyltransferase